MDDGKTFTRLTRSSSKKMTEAHQAEGGSATRMKKSRVTLQLDFDEHSSSANSPAMKKSKDVTLPKSKSKREKSSYLADVQNLVNLAAKYGCLLYFELPKIDEKKNMDSKGNVRAIVPKQLEEIPGIKAERPILKKHDQNAAAFSIIRPDAPTMTNGHAPATWMQGSKTKLDYLLVIDFESTCWDSKFSSPPQEIIEFPAVLINLKTGEIEEQFQQFVMPMEQPRLSEFCTNFTVSNKGMALYQAGEHSAQDSANIFVIATWTDWDFKLCLFKECERKNIKFPSIFSQWIDLKAAFRQNYGWTPKGLRGAMEDLGLTFEGREHSGLDDAINTAKLAHRMVCDGSILNRYSEL
ncbi:ERI1 exoribonuclease 2 isoform X2 [Cloeon dipterum]|uniref:ERI1 exoribonuclease 2 isoform X2 n=1 Tax=Cloeon dipterum TaxID=197152 RepID=UPI0032205435